MQFFVRQRQLVQRVFHLEARIAARRGIGKDARSRRQAVQQSGFVGEFTVDPYLHGIVIGFDGNFHLAAGGKLCVQRHERIAALRALPFIVFGGVKDVAHARDDLYRARSLAERQSDEISARCVRTKHKRVIVVHRFRRSRQFRFKSMNGLSVLRAVVRNEQARRSDRRRLFESERGAACNIVRIIRLYARRHAPRHRRRAIFRDQVDHFVCRRNGVLPRGRSLCEPRHPHCRHAQQAQRRQKRQCPPLHC